MSKKVIYQVLEAKSERYFSKESLKNFIKGDGWIVQLVRIKGDNRPQKQQPVLYKGTSVEKVIQTITPGWGQYLLTQIVENKGEMSTFKMFGFKETPRKYKVRAIELSTFGRSRRR